MIRKIRQFMNGRRGQGMSEYIIMVGLVAIAAIGIYSAFGKQIRGTMKALGEQLSGETTAKAEKETTLDTQAKKDAKLNNFGN